MPATAKGLGVKDPLNIEQNIDGGVRLLKQYSTKYNGDKELILAAYNAGPEAVKKYNGVPNYKQTKKYIAEITSKYTNYSTDLIA
jgi:soluble lytic murein transglycosylase-like protein